MQNKMKLEKCDAHTAKETLGFRGRKSYVSAERGTAKGDEKQRETRGEANPQKNNQSSQRREKRKNARKPNRMDGWKWKNIQWHIHLQRGCSHKKRMTDLFKRRVTYKKKEWNRYGLLTEECLEYTSWFTMVISSLKMSID